jgi:hypothetical protein
MNKNIINKKNLDNLSKNKTNKSNEQTINSSLQPSKSFEYSENLNMQSSDGIDLNLVEPKTREAIHWYNTVSSRPDYPNKNKHLNAWLQLILEDESSQKDKIISKYQTIKTNLIGMGIFSGTMVFNLNGEEDNTPQLREDSKIFNLSIEKAFEIFKDDNSLYVTAEFQNGFFQDSILHYQTSFKLKESDFPSFTRINSSDFEIHGTGNSTRKGHVMFLGSGGGFIEGLFCLKLDTTPFNVRFYFEFDENYDVIKRIDDAVFSLNQSHSINGYIKLDTKVSFRLNM